MKIDVSEIKEFRHCKRKWQLSSRNQYHMAPVVTPTAFKLGTVFHESLHKLYLGKPFDEVTDYVRNELEETNSKDIPMLLSMVKGYNDSVLADDLDCYDVADIEWHFEYTPSQLLWEYPECIEFINSGYHLRDVTICGSIDMIVIDKDTNEVWGFEHKTAKNFRNDTYLWIDEQPRLYYAALKLWVAQYNATHERKVTLGGVFINEVRKLVRAFENKRSVLTYPESDLRNFLLGLMTSVAECHKMVETPNAPRIPQPDLMTCGMCQFNTICQTFQYADVSLESVQQSFGELYKVRESDHLEEKQEVTNA